MIYFHDDNNSLETRFPRSHFKLKHELLNNDLFSLDKLVELAGKIPQSQMEWNAGNAAISQDPDKTPGNGLSPEETIASIAENNSWLVLKNIQSDPVYDEVLNSLLDEIEQKAGKKLTGIDTRAGFVFVSSPGAVTPYHMDPEHNFLLQLRGSKTMYIWDPWDESVITQEHIENTYFGENAHRNLEHDPALDSKAEAMHLLPGDALHVPIHAPHWVKVGDEVSISISITFRSDQSRRDVRLHTLNARLRRMGMKPSVIGTHKAADQLKDFFVRSAVSAKRIAGGGR